MSVRQRRTALHLAILAIALLLGSRLHGQAFAATHPLVGEWVGGYKIDGEWTFVAARFVEQSDNIVGTLDFRFDMTTRNALSAFTQTPDNRISFMVEKGDNQLVFDGFVQDNTFVGSTIVGEFSSPFILHRVYPLPIDTFKSYIGNYQTDAKEATNDTIILLSAQDFHWFGYFDTATQRDVRLYPLSTTDFFSELGDEITIEVDQHGQGKALSWRTQDGRESIIRRASPYQEEEVRYPFGDSTLAGTLLLPSTPGPHPAIVLMHGTSPQNRDYSRRWGHYFAARGIAALVYDKAGAFDSAHPRIPTYWHNSVDDLANAAVAGVHYLQERPEIHPQQVGIGTFSNSSWAGPVAAAASPDVAFLIGVATSGVAQRQADVFQDDINNISYYDYPDWAAHSALTYLRFTREFSIFARKWNLPLPGPIRDYYGQDFDPMTAWKEVTQPVLVINGQYDTVVDPVDAVARIAQTLQQNNHTDHTLIVYPNADHGLYRTKTGLRAEARGGRNRVLAPGFTDMMTDWVSARFDGTNTTPQQTQQVQSPVPVHESAHFAPGGRYALLPWYGRPLWQLTLFFLFIGVFGPGAIGLPIHALVCSLRRRPISANRMRVYNLLCWLASLLALGVLAGLVWTWIQIVHIQIGGLRGLAPWLHLLPTISVLTSVLLAIVLWLTWHNRKAIAHAGATWYGIVIFNLTGLLFIWYLGYWHLLVG